ncbi:MAG: hypothetical protein JRJ03_13115 [Deltaproteobacteria bacterium]|nr:hypothetical protein [Deltaproteobacteria bacterium]
MVELDIDIECTRDFVERLLGEYTLMVKISSPCERRLELSYSPARQRNFLASDRGLKGQSQVLSFAVSCRPKL